MRRRGSSRSTRTQTPAKKENPTLDGFEAAWMYDAQKHPDQHQPSNSSAGPANSTLGTVESKIGLHQAPALNKEPTQVYLQGFSPDTQWAAISFYETVSGGIVCEDYERHPPHERRKYQNSLGNNGYSQPRPLTKAERASTCQYKGGSCWIKVTFDSAEAAERAIDNSPHLLQGHWVYAHLFRGQGPEVDEPILARKEVRDQGLLGARRTSQTIGASFSISGLNRDAGSRVSATLPKSFTTRPSTSRADQQLVDTPSMTSSTVSSGTATGLEYPDLRRFDSPHACEPGSSEPKMHSQSRPETFTHFPGTTRTVMRPASEAFLPQPSWTDNMQRRLTRRGLIPGDIIGSAVPRLENGEFDWRSASFYWRFCYWIDTIFGTDICGMKES